MVFRTVAVDSPLPLYSGSLSMVYVTVTVDSFLDALTVKMSRPRFTVEVIGLRDCGR